MATTTKNEPMKLVLSSSPHIRGPKSTTDIMLDVLIALLPVVICSTILYGARVIINVAIAAVTAVAAEYVSQLVMKRRQTIKDLSAVVTAVILVLNLPAEFPIWQLILGVIFAIVLVKQVFGGIGQNFMNPAMIARVALVASFAGSFAKFTMPTDFALNAVGTAVDSVSSATPLSMLKRGAEALEGAPSIKDMFFGTHVTMAVGESFTLAILLGLAYLLVRGIIKPHIPVAYLGTVALCAYFFGAFDLNYVLYHLLSGGVLFAAVFMLTDYATSPLTNKGKIIFGIGAGLITCLIRFWGNMNEGVSFSVIIMNILTPHIDTWTRSLPFGRQEKLAILAKEEGAIEAHSVKTEKGGKA